MLIQIDTARKTLTADGRAYPLYGPEAFRALSGQWLKVGWNLGHWAGFSWMGRQFLQLPDDALRLAELAWNIQPDIILETGVYEGGGTLFLATLCRMAGHGRVLAVEKDLRPGVREALGPHPEITLIEGDSGAPETAARVRALVPPDARVLVFLDSDHHAAHVSRELEAYAPLVNPGGWLVVADTAMPEFAAAPEGEPGWTADSPRQAVEAFLAGRPDFVPGRADSVFSDLTYCTWLKSTALSRPRPGIRGY